jgi:argininosuccinate lyase
MTNDATHKTWSGRFDEPVSERVKRYTASIPFDWRLWRHDIQGSLAHARMLAKQGIISTEDLAAIERGMAQIAQEIESGAFEWSLDDEDIHLNIERRLTALVGDAGKRLHTGRSRNDQVATDIRLWLRDAIDEIRSRIRTLQTALLDLAEQHAATPMPGFTHLQVAQPVTFGHHLMAYVRCWSATGSGSPIAAAAPTACLWALPHLPAPPTRSIGGPLPKRLGSKSCVAIRSMR